MRIVSFLLFWSGVFVVAINGWAFAYAIFTDLPLWAALSHYFGCIYILHLLKEEVLWERERARLASIARARGYLV